MNKPPVNHKSRDMIAIMVISLSALILVVTVTIILIKGDGDEAMTVFTTLLPLVGTWVGTVLAYYFSKENFEAASRSMQEAVKLSQEERLKLVTVREAWMPVDQATKLELGERTPDKVPLADVDAMFQGKVSRVPVLDAEGKCLCVIHQSVVNQFLRAVAKPENATLQDLLDDEKAGSQVVLFAYVSVEGNLADAKARMEEKKGSQDVVVTKTGAPDEPMLGWITNVRLSRHLKA